MSSNDSQVTTLDDAPAIASAPVKTIATKPAAARPVVKPAAADADAATDDGAPEVEAIQMFNVTVHATGDAAGNDIVDVQVNTRLYRLPRGVPCLVPEHVLHVLQNAIVTTYSVVGADIVERNIPRFPFTAVPA